MFKLDKIFLTLTRKNFTTSTNEQYKALLNKVGSFLNKVQSTSPEILKSELRSKLDDKQAVGIEKIVNRFSKLNPLQEEYFNIVLEEHLNKEKKISYLHLKTNFVEMLEVQDKVENINPAFFKQQEFMSEFTEWLAKQPKPDLGLGPASGTVVEQQEGNAAAKEEPKKEAIKPIIDVELTSFEPAKKIALIKEVRSMTNLGLKEAKELVERAPVVLVKGMKREEADELCKKLTENGAKITYK